MPPHCTSSLGDVESLPGSCQPRWAGRGAVKLWLQPPPRAPVEGPDAHTVPLSPHWASPGPSAGSSPLISHHRPPKATSILVPGGLSWTGDRISTCENGSSVRVMLYSCHASPGTGDGWATCCLPLLQAEVWGELSSQAHSRWLSVPVVLVTPAWLWPHVCLPGFLLPGMLRDPCANLGSLQPWQPRSLAELRWASHQTLCRRGLSL